MKRIKLLNVLCAVVFIFQSQFVFGAEKLSKEVIPSDSGSEYDESGISIPPDTESTYEESLFWVGEKMEGEVGKKVAAVESKLEDKKESDKSMQDLKLRLLEEQQQRLQRTIAEDSQR